MQALPLGFEAAQGSDAGISTLFVRWRFARCGGPSRHVGASDPRIRYFKQNRFVFCGALFRQSPAFGGILAVLFCVIHQCTKIVSWSKMPEWERGTFALSSGSNPPARAGTKSRSRVFPSGAGETADE
jgi:hypothetical protein